jgi:hypothetical protein
MLYSFSETFPDGEVRYPRARPSTMPAPGGLAYHMWPDSRIEPLGHRDAGLLTGDRAEIARVAGRHQNLRASRGMGVTVQIFEVTP